jgi:hypothetical protein
MIIPNCLTPGEADIFSLDNVQEAITLLDLVPVPSKSFKTNIAIETRVSTWLAEAPNSRAAVISAPRTILDMWATPIVDPGAFNQAKCPF